MSELTVTVTSVTGNKVWQEQHTDVGKNFTKEVDVRGMASGLYFVELKSDREKTVRKLLVD